jgi:hypothetical protein
MLPGRRVIEDYAVVYFGSALFKIIRLLLIATISVHFFACIFYRVKVGSSEELVEAFFAAKGAKMDVSSHTHSLPLLTPTPTPSRSLSISNSPNCPSPPPPHSPTLISSPTSLSHLLFAPVHPPPLYV